MPARFRESEMTQAKQRKTTPMTRPPSMRAIKALPALTLAAALALAGCAQFATVSETKPQFHPVGAATGGLATVEQEIAKALPQQKREPLAAMGEYLAAAKAAEQQLVRNPGDTAA